jgi:hypothetical protein
MKGQIITTLILLVTMLSFAQQDKVLTGQIFDETTGETIPYATIEIFEKEIGTAANSKGIYSLQLPNDFINQTLSISALGYSKKEIQINNEFDIKNCSIYLEPQIYTLPEFTFRDLSGQTEQLGNTPVDEDKGGSYPGLIIGEQIAVYMKPKTDYPAIIKFVSFHIEKKTRGFKRANTPFRIRIYEFDTIRNEPGQDLLSENLIVSAPKKGDWFSVDVSSYQISVPKNGFFIAMEWIYTDDKYYYSYIDKYDNNEEKTRYGQTLTVYFWNEESITWYNWLGKKWVKEEGSLPKIGGGLKKINAAIYCEIEFVND